MKKGICLFSLIACLTGMVKGQDNKGFELTGRINGLAEGEKIKLEVLDPGLQESFPADSAIVKNGEFKIQGAAPDGPRDYSFSFSKHQWGFQMVINNGEKITLSSDENLGNFRGDIGSYIRVYGSAYFTAMAKLDNSFLLYRESVMNIKKRIMHFVDSAGFDPVRINEMFQCVKDADEAFGQEFFSALPNGGQTDIETKMAYPIYGWSVSEFSHHAPFMVEGYNELTPEMKNSFYGKKLREYIKLCVGQPFPEFTLPTPEGKMLSLKEVTGKSKLTLIHFWGTDSYVKKPLQDELKILYPKYRDKGFNIIGFYTDPYENDWKELVKKEQYPWYNVSDLKGKYGMAAKVYNEYIRPHQTIANTTNVLIDDQGKIVAWDLYGPELKWLLWKYCDKGGGTK